MLLDLNQKFVNLDGKVILDIIKNENVADTVRDLTLLRVITLALMEPDIKVTDDDKIIHFELCLKVIANKAGTVELTAEETALIKSLIKPKYGILIVGEALRMLEGKEIGIEIIPDKLLLDEQEPMQENEDKLDLLSSEVPVESEVSVESEDPVESEVINHSIVEESA